MYKVDKAHKDLTVWIKEGKVILKDASQKDLKKLFEMGVKGITKEEKKAKDESESK